MASVISALTSGGGGISMTGDASGILNLNSNGTTVVAVTSTSVAVTGTLAATGAITGSSTVAGSTGILYPLTSGTAVASTSGTSIDFTSIPSWVKKITFMFKAVSTNGSGNWLVRLGTSGGIVTTGYLGSGVYAGATPGGVNSTAGFIFPIGGAAQSMHGSMIITLEDSATNAWVQQGVLGDSSQQYMFFSGGSLALSGVLDRIRLTTVAGTDTFDAGSVNILYE
jgi:hypothetical protein